MKKISPVTKLASTLACAAMLACVPAAFASGSGHDAPAVAVKSAEGTIKAAVSGNDQFTSHNDSHHFDGFQTGQTPTLTVVTCSDSRVHTHLFGMEPDNNIFVIRNIGNQVKNAEGSVDYGVRHLPTNILMIMGHSSCGAVKAAMGDYSGETKGIKAELDTLKPVIAAGDNSGDINARWSKNVERNVDYQVKSALELYKEKVQAKELTVVGAVYDFNDLYGKGRGRLVITNINGETNPAKIMAHPVLKELNRGEIVNHVGSLAPAL
ncbi:carbonic anhydrase [Thiovibrio frasassiensis]|uniref:carbonic anhydrase n=1 Tax=Thiovibrio frasassiensis TaxID=2984131 RepID=A0A9X4MPI0_9BACT|nr:carbonic anhydrase [Thiovibrio frasassiensis]MDG4476522.1 carbonic anhydrase [Thiovibrio frasassiensis]